MKYSLIGGIIGGIISGLLSILADNVVVFFIGVLVASIFSGFDKKIFHRLIGLFIFYITSALLMFLHTAIFASNALFGWLALIFYSIIIIPLYLIVGLLVHKIAVKKMKRGFGSHTR